MSFEQIRLDKHEGIALLTLYRPEKMNAFTADMMAEIIAALDECDADDSVRAVIFTGHGEKAYCAGADLGSGGDTFDYDKRADKLGQLPEGVSKSPVAEDGTINWSHPLVQDGGGRVSMRIFAAKKPVLGAINGAAVGLGATTTLPLDARLASRTARPGFSLAARGTVP
ncbi:MAG: enoyl-CoA hydratase/isomerase family protein, partial [Sphingopyxis sp.]|nr:enoyl-CoA hydratase/isomerase family protein [Sphingopyxis sp.]